MIKLTTQQLAQILNADLIGDKTLHFSDQEVAEAYLTKK